MEANINHDRKVSKNVSLFPILSSLLLNARIIVIPIKNIIIPVEANIVHSFSCSKNSSKTNESVVNPIHCYAGFRHGVCATSCHTFLPSMIPRSASLSRESMAQRRQETVQAATPRSQLTERIQFFFLLRLYQSVF